MSTQEISVPVAPDRGGAQSLLTVELRWRGLDAVVEVRGEIDLGTAHVLTELVEHVARRRPARVVLDLAEVSFLCADGLRALLYTRETVTATGGLLLLRDPSPKTRRVLTITRTCHLFVLDTALAPVAVASANGGPRGPATDLTTGVRPEL
jgi:anti-anti-sigma factor